MLGGATDRAGRVLVERRPVGRRPRADVFADRRRRPRHVDGDRRARCRPRSDPGRAHRRRQAIRADLAGEPRPTFALSEQGRAGHDRPIVGGRHDHVAGRGIRLSGWIAWMAWWSIHVVFLIDFRSRLSVLLNWAWNYLTFQRGARLITGPWRPDRDRGRPRRTLTPRRRGRRRVAVERSGHDGRAHPVHQLDRPGHVVDRQQPRRRRLTDLEQVADVAAAVAGADVARARRCRAARRVRRCAPPWPGSGRSR